MATNETTLKRREDAFDEISKHDRENDTRFGKRPCVGMVITIVFLLVTTTLYTILPFSHSRKLRPSDKSAFGRVSS